jgi:uncharacterized protein
MLADHIGVPQLRDLASRSEQIVDIVDIRDMSRVGDLLHSAKGSSLDNPAGKLNVEVGFHGGMQGSPEISLKVSGMLAISCQRCLGLLERPVDLDFHLVVVESDSDLDNIAEPYDAVVAGEHGVQLVKVIEDELLASLPLAPVHEDTDDCIADKNLLNKEQDEDQAEEVNRPFSELASLMGKSPKSDPKDKTN